MTDSSFMINRAWNSQEFDPALKIYTSSTHDAHDIVHVFGGPISNDLLTCLFIAHYIIINYYVNIWWTTKIGLIPEKE